MIRFFAERIAAAAARLILAAVLILLLIEVSYVLLGSAERHAWNLRLAEIRFPGEFSAEASSWIELIGIRFGRSSLAVSIAFLSILCIGYGWGVLGARLRYLRLGEILVLPFGILSALPPFWVISCFVIHSVHRWHRPGYANELTLGSGFTLLDLWHSSLMALVLLPYPAVWLIRRTAVEVTGKANRPHIKALFYRGLRSREIFYRNVVPLARPGMVSLIDRPVSFLLGALIPIEWAFKFPGAGSLFLELVRTRQFEGIAIVALTFSLILIAVTLFREIVEFFFTPASRYG